MSIVRLWFKEMCVPNTSKRSYTVADRRKFEIREILWYMLGTSIHRSY